MRSPYLQSHPERGGVRDAILDHALQAKLEAIRLQEISIKQYHACYGILQYMTEIGMM